MSEKIDYRNLPHLLLKARETMLVQFRPIIAHFGLTEQQWRILRVLSDWGETEQRELASACGMLGPSLTGVLSRMEEQELIARSRLPFDQRRVHVRLTPPGERVVQALKPLIQRQYRNIERALGPAVVSELIDALDRFLGADHAAIAQVPLPPVEQVDQGVGRLSK